MTPHQFRFRRHQLGLTQQQAALVLGMSESMIQNYEYGTYPVPFTVCFTLVNITKKDVKNLLTNT